MQVRVRYLGMLKEIAGRDGESVEVADDAPVGELYAALQQRIPQLQRFRHAIALAVNYEYSNSETQLREGDEVALIPPVSGGAPGDSAISENAGMQATEHAALVRDPCDGGSTATARRQPEEGAVVGVDCIVRNHTN